MPSLFACKGIFRCTNALALPLNAVKNGADTHIHSNLSDSSFSIHGYHFHDYENTVTEETNVYCSISITDYCYCQKVQI